MRIHIKHAIRKDKKKVDGSYTIYLRLTQGRRSYYVATDISVQNSDWNSVRGEVRASNKLAKQYNSRLRKNLLEAENKRATLEKEGSLSAELLKDALMEKPDSDQSVLELARKYHDNLQNEKRFHEWKKFGVIINDLESYSEKKIYCKELNPKLIEGFIKYLLQTKENGSNTIRRKLRTFKAFTRLLLISGKISEDPFTDVRKPKRTKSEKPKLDKEQIKKINELSLQEGSKLWHARNYFIFSFLAGGVRFGDLSTLKGRNIVDDKLIYNMRKTNVPNSIPLSKAALKILKVYNYKEIPADEYIFPIIDNSIEDPFEIKRKISSNTVMQNNRLKKVGEIAGIDQKITTHVARHSFAHCSLVEGKSVYSISKMMGHSNTLITENYLRAFDQELVYGEMEGFFDDML